MKNLFLFGILFLSIISCKKNKADDASLPTVSTSPLSAVTSATVVSGGNVSSEGGAAVTARGVCWSNTTNPTITTNHTTDGSGTGTFTSYITGLTPGTVYYVRAYATSSKGTAYGNEISTTTTTPEVYVAGYINSFSFPVAALWKNGNLTLLSSGPSNASSVFVSGTDVYIAGYDRATYDMATLWKNGVASTLPTHAGDAAATSVFVSGSDVYVAGFEYGGSHKVAKYWKNNVPVLLTSGTNDAYANSIYVVGNDVYVAGSEFNGSYDVAKVWKNGIATSLTNGTGSAIAYSVSVSGTDVYVAGYERVLGKYRATLWKNAVTEYLTPATSDAIAYSVFVSGVNVYATGYETTAFGTEGKLWTNSIPVTLPHGSIPGYPVYGKSVFVTGSDVYAAGFALVLSGSTNYAGRTWKNGVVGYLSPSSSAKEIIANSIFVK